MKKLIGFLLLALMVTALQAQSNKEVNGIWFGTLKTPNGDLRLGFEVTGAETDSPSTVMTSIDQGNAKVDINSTELKDGKLIMKHPAIDMVLQGPVNAKEGVWDAKFTQMGFQADLKLEKVDALPE